MSPHRRLAGSAPRPTVTPTADILAQLSRPRPPEPSEAAEAPPVDAAEREALIDRVLRDVLEDPESGFRNVAVLYQDFLVRCRIQRVPGEPLALPAFRRRLAIGRARVSEEVAARGEWQRVLDDNGQILLLEHGRSSWSLISSFLDRNLGRHVHKFGCYWNRDIAEIVRQAGLEVVEEKRQNFGTTHIYVCRPRPRN